MSRAQRTRAAMDAKHFEQIAAEEFAHVPSRVARRLSNIALLIEDAPTVAIRTEEKLKATETLLGLYRGVPANARGAGYGIGMTAPDTITLYRIPVLTRARIEAPGGVIDEETVRRIVRETLWHEIGHAFGLSEPAVEAREAAGTNHFNDERD
ncbi:MAG: hypothetical protein B7X04_01285 [Parcubacteria group bacterium 21-54-25]|nr:MAG: hypothetical protein B7X04_01285 [Parcubacteria group bacterium 21-54-25]HQU07564.1 metallopeptidase family protein [Candidatus Paceibacterota bacterium]